MNFYITRKLWQAIECSLFGVKPKDSKVWSREAVSAFADLVTPFDDINNSAFLKVILVANFFCELRANFKFAYAGVWQDQEFGHWWMALFC